ncbi:ABC transporter permease [Aureimonas pseudogalii]|uniref:Peptide/nickel transport system permease protein n=1 Tax=Aureimonas pseudogalii TaxID=1744844 RepID=A0A7W6EDE3_9HYPH|nr:ABC transporter permease [Aureimonas pseudogalii]MBB3998006.1 peptide/nickel transport system permease protein [Aureimonas pseudogalii]
MMASLARRTAILLALLVAVSAIVFAVMNLLPGDPAAVMLGTAARPDTLAALRTELGLDQPRVLRWLRWLAGVVHGDFGRSITYGVPVSDLVAQRLVVTLPLAASALLLAVGIGLPLGILAASRRGSPSDHLAAVFAQLGVALPNFWIGLLLVLLVSSHLGWLPAGGFPGWSAGASAVSSLALPTLALALPQAAVLTRVTRAAVLDTAGEDFMRTALAKGLSRRAALLRHGVRNALIPVVTVIGLQFSYLLAGTVLVENVFALPGLGQLAYLALQQRDLMTVQAVALLFAGSVVVVNGLVDLLHLWIDPRLRSQA